MFSLGSVRARENERTWTGGSERPGEHGPDVVGGETRDECGARARGRGGGGRLARREQEPGDGPAGHEERGAGVEHDGAGARVLRVGLGLARPAGVGLAAVGRVEERVVRAPVRGRDNPAHEGEGAGAPETDGKRVAERRATETRVGRHGGRVGPTVDLERRVDARPVDHRHQQLLHVTRHGHVKGGRVVDDLPGERRVGAHREEHLPGEGEGLDPLGRDRRGRRGVAAVTLGLELGALGAGGPGGQARDDGTPVTLGRRTRRREVHDELVGCLRDRVRHVGGPLPPQGGGEATGVEVGRRGEHQALVLEPCRTRQGGQRSVSRREGAARGGDPTRIRQRRSGGLRGGSRLPGGDDRHTEHGEKRESGQTAAVHDVANLLIDRVW